MPGTFGWGRGADGVEGPEPFRFSNGPEDFDDDEGADPDLTGEDLARGREATAVLLGELRPEDCVYPPDPALLGRKRRWLLETDDPNHPTPLFWPAGVPPPPPDAGPGGDGSAPPEAAFGA